MQRNILDAPTNCSVFQRGLAPYATFPTYGYRNLQTASCVITEYQKDRPYGVVTIGATDYLGTAHSLAIIRCWPLRGTDDFNFNVLMFLMFPLFINVVFIV